MNPDSYLPCALLIKSSELMHNKSQFLQMNSWLWQEHSGARVSHCLKSAHTCKIYHVGVPLGCAGICGSQQNDISATSGLEKRVFSLFCHSVVAIQLENQECSTDQLRILTSACSQKHTEQKSGFAVKHLAKLFHTYVWEVTQVLWQSWWDIRDGGCRGHLLARLTQKQPFS